MVGTTTMFDDVTGSSIDVAEMDVSERWWSEESPEDKVDANCDLSYEPPIDDKQPEDGTDTSSDDLEDTFQSLYRDWKAQSEHLSSITDKSILPPYQRIIGMGLRAVPLILRELNREPDFWYWALQAITGENPVSPENRGRIDEMAREWVEWGHRNNFI